jgi:NAD(P)-dependent dehydrogenase (short-subunit alcohol dehydrogenase family)
VVNATPVVVITGAGSGIGAAAAERFAREGWELVLIGRRPEALEATAKRITQLLLQAQPSRKPVIHILPVDIANLESISVLNRWTNMSAAVANRIHALVHCAGIFERNKTMVSTDVSWHSMFETNLFAVIRVTQILYPPLKQNRGSITNISSTLGLRPTMDTAAYSASKAALNNWTQSFALEAAKDGVRVNAVCPGIVDTPIHDFHAAADKASTLEKLGPIQPLGRIGQPSEIAHMVWTLAGPGSEWTTGATIAVDGGISLT